MKNYPAPKPLKALHSAVAAALISVGAVHTVHAQIPVTDVASLLQQIQSYLQIVSQYETQIRQYQTQIQQYQNMIQNTSQLLNGGSWTNIQSALAGINSILNNGQSIIVTATSSPCWTRSPGRRGTRSPAAAGPCLPASRSGRRRRCGPR